MTGTPHRYIVALGSNMRHVRHGAPAAVLRAAVASLGAGGLSVIAASPIASSAPVGPSRRRYANAVALIETSMEPAAVLTKLQNIEADFGRRRTGQRWGARVLDLDVVLWTGGAYRTQDLTIPHPQMAARRFVLEPAVAIARRWRPPGSSRTLAHLLTRLTRPRPTSR